MGSYEIPDNWGTLNEKTAPSGVFTATKASPGMPGNYFLKLTSKNSGGKGVTNGIAVSGKLDTSTLKPISGFPYTQRPAVFTGKWQYMPFSSSIGQVSATLTKWNSSSGKRDTIAVAGQPLAGMIMSWSVFSLNFIYQNPGVPDTCIIYLAASGAVPFQNDYLWVDSLALSGSAAGIYSPENFTKELNVFPIPAKENLSIDFSLYKPMHIKLKLVDATGKIVWEDEPGIITGHYQNNVAMARFAKGIYILNILSENQSEIKKVLIE